MTAATTTTKGGGRTRELCSSSLGRRCAVTIPTSGRKSIYKEGYLSAKRLRRLVKVEHGLLARAAKFREAVVSTLELKRPK